MKPTLFCCLLVCSLGLANLRGQETNKPEEKKPMDTNQKEVAVLKTSDGEMVVEFWPEVAPRTVANFEKLAREGFYNGTAFHRIMRGFMIQGGDPLTKDASNEARFGTGGPGYSVPAEFNDRPHLRGVLSMARSADPNSAGSQFFICLGTVSQLDHQVHGVRQSDQRPGCARQDRGHARQPQRERRDQQAADAGRARER